MSFTFLPVSWIRWARSWVWVTATVEVKYHTLYKGVGPILTAVNVQPAEPAEQNVATF